MTSNGVTENGEVYAFEFSVSASQGHGGSYGHKDTGGGVRGSAADDASQENLIDVSDKAQRVAFAGHAGYSAPVSTWMYRQLTLTKIKPGSTN
jgi:hypothetical protein